MYEYYWHGVLALEITAQHNATITSPQGGLRVLKLKIGSKEASVDLIGY